MIALIYNGDIRFNQEVAGENHRKLIVELEKLAQVNLYKFTRDDLDRPKCPYDSAGTDLAEQGKYRRGQGGAVQVWDFLQSVNRVNEDIVIRMRTDTWFTDSSIPILINEISKILNQETDIAFFGSDLINNHAGVDHKEIALEYKDGVVIPGKIQDFVIVARRNILYSLDYVVKTFNELPPGKLRSGNKNFRHMIVTGSRGKTVICNIFLIRKYFYSYPTDIDVFESYIDSYIEPSSKKGKVQKQKTQMADAYRVLEQWKIQ